MLIGLENETKQGHREDTLLINLLKLFAFTFICCEYVNLANGQKKKQKQDTLFIESIDPFD